MQSMTSAAEPQRENSQIAGSEVLLRVQSLVAERFGKEVDSSAGAAALEITARQVSLTDQDNRVIARTPRAVADALKISLNSGTLTVTLEPLAARLVRWYAEGNGREEVDVANGVISGELSHLREEIEGEFQDDSYLHLAEYVGDAVVRRKIREARVRNGRRH